MSLRSLSYLLTRRFYPRKIYSIRAVYVPAAGRPGHSLRTLRDLIAGESTYVPLIAAVLAGGLGILIFKKHRDDADNNMTNKCTKEEEVRSKKPEVTDNKPMQEVTYNIDKHVVKVADINPMLMKATEMEKWDMDMEVRFHEWKKWVGRVYPNQEEETRRFERFKESMNAMDREFAGKPLVRYLPNLFADMTVEEVREMLCHPWFMNNRLKNRLYIVW